MTVYRSKYVEVTVDERENGCDLHVVPLMRTADVTYGHGGCVDLHVRDIEIPRIGQRVMLGGRLVEVCDIRYDNAGRVHVMDTDTGAWILLENGKVTI